MSAEQHAALMRRFVEEVWNQRRLDVTDELFAPEATSPSTPWVPPGPDGVKLLANRMFSAFPDFHMNIDRIVAVDDRVAGRFIETGTHQGAFMGVAPTGKQVTFTEMAILRVRAGKVVESWYESDMLGLMQQLGAIPAPATAG